MRPAPLRAALIALAVAAPLAFVAFAQEEPPAADPAAETPDPNAPHPRNPDEIYADLNFFGEVLDRIRAEYVDAPDERVLIRAAIQGMLTSLDPHSGYLSPDDFTAVQEDTSGQFGGLGIEVTMDQGVIKVIAPIDDTPASRAGILANDYIVELNGRTVQGMVLDDAVEMMRGPIGSEVKLTVIREGAMVP